MQPAKGKYYELADRFYLLRASGKKMNHAQAGGIVLAMIEDGFDAETVEQILQSHGFDENHAKDLIRACLRISAIYADIRGADPVPEILTEKDAYRSLAKAYMREHNLSKLDRKGDLDIVRRMYAKGWKEDFVRRALCFSPVASEPWRNKALYVDVLCSYVRQKQKLKKGADGRYAITAFMYEEKMQSLRKKYSTDIEANRKYYDGIVARELLEEHQLRADIARVIAEKSPEAKKETGKRLLPSRYAHLIVSASYAVLQAEYALLGGTEKQIPSGKSYMTLKAQGITAEDLYKDAIRQRVRDYPSTAGILTAPFVDRDAAEYLLSRYPDMDRRDLEDALHFCSPRAQMPGIDIEYPMSVIDEVYRRKAALELRKEKQRAFCEDMEKSIRLEKNAFKAGAPIWNLALCTGLAAVRMLQDGYTPMDVLPALVQPPDILEEDAGKIVGGAEIVLSRVGRIQQYIPLTDTEKETVDDRAKLAEDEYIRLYQTAQADKDRLMSDLDIEIARNMLLSGHEPEIVIEAIREASPVAAEPGRNEDYAEYVQQQAEIAIEKEQERLKYYRPMPRNEHEEDAEKEYEYHLRNMRSAFFLPHTSIMDMRIAETMLVQGFQAAAIGAAIQKLSPCAKNDAQYGNDILCSMDSKAKGFSRTMEPPVRVRTLGV